MLLLSTRIGAQWLNSRTLDLELKGRWLKTNRKQCVVSLNMTLDPLLTCNTGLTPEGATILSKPLSILYNHACFNVIFLLIGRVSMLLPLTKRQTNPCIAIKLLYLRNKETQQTKI